MADLNTAKGDNVGSMEDIIIQVNKNIEEVTHQVNKNIEEVTHQVNKNIEEVTHQVNKNIEEVTHQVNPMQKNVEEVTRQGNTMQKNVEEVTHQVNPMQKNVEEVTHQGNTMQKNVEEVTHKVNTMQKNVEEVTHQVNTMQKNFEEVTHQVNTMQKNVEEETRQTKLLFVEVKKAVEHSNDAISTMALRYDKLEIELLNAKTGTPDVYQTGVVASPIIKGEVKECDSRPQSADDITDVSIEIEYEQKIKGSDDKNEPVEDASSLKCGSRENEATDDTEEQSSILNHLRGYAERSTMHGVLRLFINSRNVRIFWGILLISVLGISMWQFVGLFQDYFGYPVYIDVEIKNKPPTFPKIITCKYTGRFKKSKLYQHPVLQNVTYNFTTPTYTWTHPLILLPEEDKKQLMFTANEFLHIHVYDGLGAKVYTPTLVDFPYLANCYSFTAPENATRIVIALNSNVRESFDVIEAAYDDDDYDEVIVLLPVYEPATIKKDYIWLKTNVTTSIHYRLEKYNRLNGVYGQCQDDEDLFRKRTGFNYTRWLCEQECKITYVQKKCECLLYDIYHLPSGFQLSNIAGVRSCLSSNDSKCKESAIKLFSPFLDCQCKERCQTLIYSLKVKTHDLSTYGAREKCVWFNNESFCSNTTDAFKWWRENIAEAIILPPDNFYKEFTQMPLYPFSRFISDIGGTLGFYCGSSILTVFEVIQLLLALMMYLFSSLRAR